MAYGMAESRSPNAYFNNIEYLKMYPDIAAAVGPGKTI